MKANIIESSDQKGALEFRGGALLTWKCKDAEVMLAGPAETGKTRAALEKMHAICMKYPRTQALMIRKTYSSITTTACRTFEDKVLGAWDRAEGRFDPRLTIVHKYGGERPQFYMYPNGSRITVGGLDQGESQSNKASRILSAEYDFIYVNQCEEIMEEEWETLMTRCTGRAGNTPYPQVLGDCNPSYPTHWIKSRSKRTLTFFESKHKDNPSLYDIEKNCWTEQGERSMRILDALTGTRKLRLKDGLWVQAEGVIYPEWMENVHVLTAKQFKNVTGHDDIPRSWPKYRAIDFGYVHPFVCLWAAIDHDRRIYIYRQVYHTSRTVQKHAKQILGLSRGEQIRRTVCDHDASDRATLLEQGIQTTNAYKHISRGIEHVRERLLVQKDGLPRLFVLADSLVEPDTLLKETHLPTSLQEEFPTYIWRDHVSREEPVDENNHGQDALRYLVGEIDNLKRRYARPARRVGASVIYGGMK